MNPTHPRCASDTCVRCRKKFSTGDRSQIVMIVDKVGRNPKTQEIGAFLSEQFELAHIDCADVGLSGRIIS